MRIAVRKTNRKSVAYSLAPEELTILIPKDRSTDVQLEKVLSAANGSFTNKETMTVDEFNQMLDSWIEKLRVKPKMVKLKSMKSKWASCSLSESVTFNSSLTSMPKEFVDYVVCHELLHFKVPNHNRLFKNMLFAYMPDWQERIQRTIDYVLTQNNEKNCSTD